MAMSGHVDLEPWPGRELVRVGGCPGFVQHQILAYRRYS